MAESRTSRTPGLTYGLPTRKAEVDPGAPTRTGPADDTHDTLDDARFLEHVEADLAHDENRRKIRGILKGVAVGTFLWILLIAVVIIAL